MDELGHAPDPHMRVVVLASMTPQEAALLAGRLQAEGIRCIVAPGQRAPGAWTAIIGSAGLGMPASLFQQGGADVLVDERDLEDARTVAARFLDQQASSGKARGL